MNVRIFSFSFKIHPLGSELFNGDKHGGGFIFDCRGIPNPGRYESMAQLTGLDEQVINYLKALPEAQQFLTAVTTLVNLHLTTFLSRGFSDVALGFGCTGGRHRSVYCAEFLKHTLDESYGPRLNLTIQHTERSLWNTLQQP